MRVFGINNSYNSHIKFGEIEGDGGYYSWSNLDKTPDEYMQKDFMKSAKLAKENNLKTLEKQISSSKSSIRKGLLIAKKFLIKNSLI